MLEWDYELALVSTLIVRWRPKSHTLYVPCEEMTITLHDEEYQLGLNIDGDPVSEYIGGWEHFYKRRSIEDICQQLLGVVPGPMIDSYRPGGLSSLLDVLGHGLPLAEPRGLEPLMTELASSLDSGGMSSTGSVDWTPYADLLIQGIVPHKIAAAEAFAAVVCPLLCFAIIKWHQVDRVVHQFGGLQHILTRPLNIDEMHGHNSRFGRGEWFLEILGAGISCGQLGETMDSRYIMRLTCVITTIFEIVFLVDAPKLRQLEDGKLPQVRPQEWRGRRRGRAPPRCGAAAAGHDRGSVSPPADVNEAHQEEDTEQVVRELSGPIPRDYLTLGPPGTSHPSEARTSQQGHATGARTNEQIYIPFNP
ncbi:hypothetical protein AHAS_Ahas04G0196900 [Arachis hypogaea]